MELWRLHRLTGIPIRELAEGDPAEVEFMLTIAKARWQYFVNKLETIQELKSVEAATLGYLELLCMDKFLL